MSDGDVPLRVRINLRLAQTEKAENILRVNRYDREGRLVSSPSTAYVTGVVLHNVVPVVNEPLRAKIALGERFKTSCAWLEGDLAAWTGRYRGKADAQLKKALESLRCRDVFNDRAAREALEAGAKVGFNPKKFRVFYNVGTRDVFLEAASATVCHWQYSVHGARFRPMTGDDVEENGVPSSAYEISDLPKGILTTRNRLESLHVSLR